MSRTSKARLHSAQPVTSEDAGKCRSGESGIVLVDVLFAVFVLAIAAIAFVDVRSNAISRSISTRSLRIARMLACQKMEEIFVNEMSEEPEDLATGGDFTEDGYPGFTYEITEERKEIYYQEDLDEDPEKREWWIREVTVKVTYKPENREKTYSLSAMLRYQETEEAQTGE
jgi:hypothetical protein